MDRETRERLKRRRKIYVRCLIFALLAALFFWGLRPEFFFKRPQTLYDSAWWLDFIGHFFIFFIVGFLAIYESRFIAQSAFKRWRSVFMECLGWGAGFEILEFIIDGTRALWLPFFANLIKNIDTLQKGNEDTMYDLIADGGGALAAILVWLFIKAIYARLNPSEARAEYLTGQSELIAHHRAEAKRLEKDYHTELREWFKSWRKNLRKNLLKKKKDRARDGF